MAHCGQISVTRQETVSLGNFNLCIERLSFQLILDIPSYLADHVKWNDRGGSSLILRSSGFHSFSNG